jgi:anti-sigma factor RsiW
VNCREFADFLNQYLDGDLPERDRLDFDRHLAVCPTCVRYLAGYRATVQLVRATARDTSDIPPAPPELVDAILRTLAIRGADGQPAES